MADLSILTYPQSTALARAAREINSVTKTVPWLTRTG
jgi:hypothetical protein